MADDAAGDGPTMQAYADVESTAASAGRNFCRGGRGVEIQRKS